MKIYEIKWHSGERSWICANTVIEALKVYCDKRNTSFDEFDKMDDIVVLPKIKWHIYKIRGLKSFNEFMQSAMLPDIIAESFKNYIYIFNKVNKIKMREIDNAELVLFKNIKYVLLNSLLFNDHT